MGNIGIINAIDLQPTALLPLSGGENSLTRVIAGMKGFPEVEKIILLVSGKTPCLSGIDTGGVETESRDIWSLSSLFSFFGGLDDGYRDLFYLYGDSPLIDSGLSARMYSNHKKYFAQYSFADGFPHGLTPEIIDTRILKTLAELAGQKEETVDRKSIFTVISRDINSFDIETEISPRDVRMLRISLTADTRRNFLLLERIMERGGTEADSILAILENQSEILRTLPAYAEVQITSGIIQKASYLPDYPGETMNRDEDVHMELASFREILAKLEEFSQDCVINLGFRGEASLHPGAGDIIAAVLERPLFRVLIETSGLGWTDVLLDRIGSMDTERISWIIALDSSDPQIYRSLRGEGMGRAETFARNMLNLYPERVWVQAVRLKDAEDPLEAFYRKWKEISPQVIIQKYDDFCGHLPSRKVTDLSPLERFPCWHLKRDLPVLLDGTVLLCREDLKMERVGGNIFTDSINNIWKAGEDLFNDHTAGNYPSICERCDEYYTFNF